MHLDITENVVNFKPQSSFFILVSAANGLVKPSHVFLGELIRIFVKFLIVISTTHKVLGHVLGIQVLLLPILRAHVANSVVSYFSRRPATGLSYGILRLQNSMYLVKYFNL